MSTESGSSIPDNIGSEPEPKPAKSAGRKTEPRVLTDAEVQKKSVRAVVLHMRKKMEYDAAGGDRVCAWLDDMDALLAQDGYDRSAYLEMRKKLSDAIEWVFDVELRHKLRNSWYSFGKAMDKKAPKR